MSIITEGKDRIATRIDFIKLLRVLDPTIDLRTAKHATDCLQPLQWPITLSFALHIMRAQRDCLDEVLAKISDL